jgi:hypothetical protein
VSLAATLLVAGVFCSLAGSWLVLFLALVVLLVTGYLAGNI